MFSLALIDKIHLRHKQSYWLSSMVTRSNKSKLLIMIFTICVVACGERLLLFAV